MFDFPRECAEIGPEAVHLPDWLAPTAQSRLLAYCREWAKPPAGLRTVRTPSGGTMSARQVCLGWHWYPYAYSDTVADGDGTPVKPFPAWLGEWARRAVGAMSGVPCQDGYDIAVINFYGPDARMGMHQDKEELSRAPVVSFSLGDACVFRFGNTRTRNKPYTDVELRSGDAFVFGGPSRLAFHGVPRVYPRTSRPELALTGRVNITLRVSGFE